MAKPVAPKYSVGDVVTYSDHHARQQHGKVLAIEATWSSWSPEQPLISYTLHHPTYRNNRCYRAEENVRGQ